MQVLSVNVNSKCFAVKFNFFKQLFLIVCLLLLRLFEKLGRVLYSGLF